MDSIDKQKVMSATLMLMTPLEITNCDMIVEQLSELNKYQKIYTLIKLLAMMDEKERIKETST